MDIATAAIVGPIKTQTGKILCHLLCLQIKAEMGHCGKDGKHESSYNL